MVDRQPLHHSTIHHLHHRSTAAGSGISRINSYPSDRATYVAMVMSPVTLRVVRHMSRMRSTPMITATSDGGTPIVERMMIRNGIDPDGTPAVPMPPMIAMYT